MLALYILQTKDDGVLLHAKLFKKRWYPMSTIDIRTFSFLKLIQRGILNVQNQPYDEALEIPDGEEVASEYSPTPRVHPGKYFFSYVTTFYPFDFYTIILFKMSFFRFMITISIISDYTQNKSQVYSGQCI